MPERASGWHDLHPENLHLMPERASGWHDLHPENLHLMPERAFGWHDLHPENLHLMPERASGWHDHHPLMAWVGLRLVPATLQLERTCTYLPSHPFPVL